MKDSVRLQFAFTRITLKENLPEFEHDRLNTGNYFYPASTVKLPIALLTIEKMNRLGLRLDDALLLHPDFACGNLKYIEKTQPAGTTFRVMLEEMLTISDNEYYSALYHFLKPKEIFQRLSELGYSGVHIFRALNGCELEGQLKTNSCEVLRDSVQVYKQGTEILPLSWLAQMYNFDEGKLVGQQHEYRGEIVQGPYDFNYNLELPLDVLHEMHLRLLFPPGFASRSRWSITPEQRLFLVDCLRHFPRELPNEAYHNIRKFPDNYYKYFLIGEDEEPVLNTISKIGLSFGFVTETAFVDFGNGNGMLMTVSMYTNADNIVNDGKYEYETVARPFLSRLGKILLENLKE